MGLSQSKIEKALKELTCSDDLFFSHNNDGTGKILWFDSDNGCWCVNTYRTNPEVEVSPMPVESFT